MLDCDYELPNIDLKCRPAPKGKSFKKIFWDLKDGGIVYDENKIPIGIGYWNDCKKSFTIVDNPPTANNKNSLSHTLHL